MYIKLWQYRIKSKVFILILSIFTLLISTAIFGIIYFTDLKVFILATLLTGFLGVIYLILFNQIASAFKARFNQETQLLKRLTLTILTVFLVSGLFLYFLFFCYETISIFNIKFYENGFVWSFLSLNIFNIFLVFLMEGISRYKDWQADRKETEKLNEAYKQSQLNGLKSQVNPHFLFNSLNTLSSLIQDDEEKAERFLDEMSKVYRYMLRNDEEQLVTLETEMKFVDAYTYLLKERYGDGLQIKQSIAEADMEKLLPALALQVIIENTFSQNVLDKNNPLVIDITTNGDGLLKIKNTVRPKKITNTMDFEAGLDNLIKKYDLLNQPAIVSDLKEYRSISLFLIAKKQEVLL